MKLIKLKKIIREELLKNELLLLEGEPIEQGEVVVSNITCAFTVEDGSSLDATQPIDVISSSVHPQPGGDSETLWPNTRYAISGALVSPTQWYSSPCTDDVTYKKGDIVIVGSPKESIHFSQEKPGSVKLKPGWVQKKIGDDGKLLDLS